MLASTWLGLRTAQVALALALALSSAAAAELPPPRGPVLLTVTGAIEHGNGDGAVELDRSMLEALGLASLVTWTPWSEGQSSFTGVLAASLMAYVGARGTEVRAVALNDYEVTIPLADFEAFPVLIALERDGRPLRVRDKGPLWVVYPWSQHPELDDRATRQKSIWQLTRLHVQ